MANRPLKIVWQIALDALRERYDKSEPVRVLYPSFDELAALLQSSRVDEAQLCQATDEKIKNSVWFWFSFGPQFAAAIGQVIYVTKLMEQG